jgi:hypothetical protein
MDITGSPAKQRKPINANSRQITSICCETWKYVFSPYCAGLLTAKCVYFNKTNNNNGKLVWICFKTEQR